MKLSPVAEGSAVRAENAPRRRNDRRKRGAPALLRRSTGHRKNGTEAMGRSIAGAAHDAAAETAVPAATPAVNITDRASMDLALSIFAKLVIISYICGAIEK